MMHFTCLLCDNFITATRGVALWDVVVFDQLTGDWQKAQWDDVQMGTVMALAIGGDNFPPELTTSLYAIAEPLFTNWPNTVRCIP